jgi:DNA polymerase-3 subunit epsilon
MRFVALDVETAHEGRESICQIGLVVFEDGAVKETWETLVNPGSSFSHFNIAVHNITPAMVKKAPRFAEVHQRLSDYLCGSIVVHHTSFDRIAIAKACAYHGLDEIDCQWLDTVKVVKRTWIEFSRRGFGLSNLANHFGIEFKHHNALEDARATGLILLRAIEHSLIPIEEWQVKANR